MVSLSELLPGEAWISPPQSRWGLAFLHESASSPDCGGEIQASLEGDPCLESNVMCWQHNDF